MRRIIWAWAFEDHLKDWLLLISTFREFSKCGTTAAMGTAQARIFDRSAGLKR
jgi:hypothetical protein